MIEFIHANLRKNLEILRLENTSLNSIYNYIQWTVISMNKVNKIKNFCMYEIMNALVIPSHSRTTQKLLLHRTGEMVLQLIISWDLLVNQTYMATNMLLK